MSEDGNLQAEVESVSSSFSGGGGGGSGTPDARSTSNAAGSKIDVAKLLAQNNDLKRLVVEEQRRAKQADDERRKKDQELRRVEVEMDGFRFRNDQLLKRIEVLQSEIAHNGKQPPAKASKSDHRQADNVVEQELMKRIQENSDLRNRLENLESLTKEQADLTAKRMTVLESELLSAEQKHQKATAGLKQERDLLSTRCAGLEKQLQQSSSDKDSTISMLEAKVASIESQMQQQRDDHSTSATSLLLVDAFCPPEYPRLNLSSCDNEQAASLSSRQRSRSVATFATNTDSLLLALGAYGTAILALIQRSGISTAALTTSTILTRTLLQKLPSPNSTSSPSSLSNSSLLSQAAIVIESLAGAFRNFIQASDSTLQASSHGVCETIDRLLSIVREAATLLLTNETPSTAPELLRLAQLSSSASGLVHDHYASLVVAFVGRAELKPPLDTALQALASASSNLDAVSCMLDTRARSADVNASPLISAIASLRQHFTERTVDLRATCHISSRPPSVKYSRAIELDASLAKVESERAALAERAERLSKRLKTAEEERERWMVEAQLRQVRYEKLLQRVTGAPAASAVTPASIAPSSSFSNLSNLRSREGSMADFSLEVAASSSNANEQNNSVDITWLSKHFEDRISLVSSDAQRSDSEAASWKAESRALLARLVQARQLSLRVTSLEKTLAERDEELETVRRSYETQLSAMAEHLATMNERIIKQADEAESLQRQMRIHQQQAQQAASSSSSSKHSRKLLSKPA